MCSFVIMKSMTESPLTREQNILGSLCPALGELNLDSLAGRVYSDPMSSFQLSILQKLLPLLANTNLKFFQMRP